MTHLPIRVAAYRHAEWISEFYVIMHSLASTVDPNLSMKEQTQWLAEQARKRLPNASFPAKMYDFIKKEYEINPDRDNWEQTRDLPTAVTRASPPTATTTEAGSMRASTTGRA
jgi:hypothetical protein